MKPPDRWPLHPGPIDGEALSSWLRRIAASYQMTVAELLEHGLGCDPNSERDLDLAPGTSLISALAHRTGADPGDLDQMTLAGWTPWLLDSLEPDTSALETYARQFSVLLKPGKRSRHAAGPWRAWMPREPLQRACPRCLDEPDRKGLLLIWQLSLTLSCPDHDVMLEPCIGFPGEYLAWTDDTSPRRAPCDAVLEMDRRTQQALLTGSVELPDRVVHVGVWFRLLRTIIDEVSTPVTYWGSHADDLERVWRSCGLPVRAGQPAWRPFEAFPWPAQTQALHAAAEALRLLEHGQVTGRGTHAHLFFPAAHPPVDDGRPPSARVVDEASNGWDRARSALEDAVQAARDDPAAAQALYDLVATGCKTREAIEQVLDNFEQLNIPTDRLSHN